MDTPEKIILEHCKDEYKPLKPLYGSVPKTSLYRRARELVNEGYLEKSKEKYRATKAGVSRLENERLSINWDELEKFCPSLKYTPTRVHRAVAELIFAAIIARRDEVRKDHHATIILAGETLKWKTWLAKYICAVLGLDPIKTIILMTSESGRSIITRKGYGGETVYQRDVLQAPFVCFDEYHGAEPSVKRLCSIYIQGEKQVPYENEVLNIEPVPLITLNPVGKGGLEEKIGFKEPQIRRSIIADLDKVEIPPDIKTKGEGILDNVRKQEPLRLPHHKSQCSEYRDSIYGLLGKCMEQDALSLVDIEMLLILCSGMTGFLPEKRAVVQVLYDYLVIVETLGWVREGWQTMLLDLNKELKGNMAEQSAIKEESKQNLSMEFDAFAERTELKKELGMFKQSFLEKAKPRTGAYWNMQRASFIEKCEWLEKNLDKGIKEAKSIYEKLKVEYERLLGEKDPLSEYRSIRSKVSEVKNELERTVNKVKRFESEKKLTLEEARRFVNEHRDLVFDLRTLEVKRERLMKELVDKKSDIAGLISTIRVLKSKAEAWKRFECVPYPDVGRCLLCGGFIDTANVPIGASFTCPNCRGILVKNYAVQKQPII